MLWVRYTTSSCAKSRTAKSLKNKVSQSDFLRIVCAEGEGQKIEFKAKFAALAKEIVAFANASGGSLFLGISDDGEIVGIDDSNRLRSQIQDVANGCDPRIDVRIVPCGNVVEIIVPEGTDKPYRCKDGFFLRIGPNSQQLNRDEILRFAIKSNKVRFDEQFESVKNVEKLLDNDRLRAFCRSKGLPVKTLPGDLLTNLGIAQKQQKHLLLTRAAVLFFCREPQRFFPEAFVTCALYADDTRSTVLDRIDVKGTMEEQFESAVGFIRRNLRVSYKIEQAGPREEVQEIPEAVFREALLNALTHRDYFADREHIFVHMHPDRMVITSPGGLPYGLTLEELGTRSVPRNRLIADMFHRMGYVERLGSGIHRMREAMLGVRLPPPKFLPTINAFLVEVFTSFEAAGVSSEGAKLCRWLVLHGPASMQDIMGAFHISKTTVHRRIAKLIADGWIEVRGSGRSTNYVLRAAYGYSGKKEER